MEVLTSRIAIPKAATEGSRFDQVRILADDLTGACDSAAAFLAAGLDVRVWLGPITAHHATEPVQAFNTMSRELAPPDAVKAVSEAAAAIADQPRILCFKKVDSAGRGQIAAEVLAAHRVLGTRTVLLAPSFPAAGRTVRGGILQVEDDAGTRIEVQLILDFQQYGTTSQIGNIGQARQAIASLATVLVCDATTQDELEALAALDTPDILYAGSAGLAKALAKVHFRLGKPFAAVLPNVTRPITFSGSLHGVTNLQMRHLAETLPQHPAIQIAGKVGDCPFILHQFETHNPDALILTGGDTALLILQTLGAQSILLRGEMANGIPWGSIQGGLADGRIVITKSGGFGTADSLTRIVRQLLGENSE